MKNNPFTSNTFTRIWLKHFGKVKAFYSFNFIGDLSFYKPGRLPIYYNLGKNLTKGISYTLLPIQTKEFRKNVFIIYDVPSYFDIKLENSSDQLGLIKTKQYPGFLVDLNSYTDFNQYFSSTFSKSSRYKLNKYKKRLENCFDISYQMYYGEMDREVYDSTFNHFKQLLRKRFDDKGITNNNLDPKEWNFYHEVAFPMILEKKASLFVIYNDHTPIGVTLNYFSDHSVFDAITVFDISYEKFHLGSVTIMKLIEWSIDQRYQYFDFSKGYFDYKKRWSTRIYNFEYHLYYDKSSPVSTFLAKGIAIYFNFKQLLREKDINTKFHSLTYKLKNRKPKNDEKIEYLFTPIEDEALLTNYEEINRDSEEWVDLMSAIFEYLYLNNESYKLLKIKKNSNEDHKFTFEGRDKKMMLTISVAH
ncbi:hypothetical protein KCTC52924_02901 [Arenibacter antarcticus]|uniref:GNAT family N-acetyltransferase n=1 Tax=Arenibacter antarcticus TaxID=2040469 RepID=A0ABW5VFZ5_9FLAO|nr:GNAT family N-acetyltransferase [Arenibacter sp. H213]MCM4167318.1 hypothetical protein [Arenibacter sp. H213]